MASEKEKKETAEPETTPEPASEPAPEAPAAKVESKEVSQPKGRTVSEEDFRRITELKELEAKEAYKKEIQAEVKEAMAKLIPEKAPFLGSSRKTEFKELSNYKKSLEMKELDKPMPHWEARASLHNAMVNMQYKEAARLTDALFAGGIPVVIPKPGTYRQPDSERGPMMKEELPFQWDSAGDYGQRMEVKELNKRLEMKAALETDTNKADASWTYGSYYQAPVEFNDIYGPALVNQLNDTNTVWGRLQKVNFAGRSSIQFRARTARNSTSAGYAEGTVFTYANMGNVGKDKFLQPFSYYHVLVGVSGQELALSRAPGGIGDVWSVEVQNSGLDLLRTLDLAVIGTGDGTSESASLGFEGLILGQTGTLYGKNIATYTTLRSFKTNASSAPVSLAQMRRHIRFCESGDGTVTSANADRRNLVIFTAPLQVDKIRGIYQAMQRIAPTSGRVGFEGMLELDGVPIMADPRINSDDMFFIDMSHTKAGVNVGPVLEELPIAVDGRTAHIKIYWNLYSDAPSNNAWIHTLDTTDP